MTRKRFVKRLMSYGCSRNDALRAASLCDGKLSHDILYWALIEEFVRARRAQMQRAVLYGDEIKQAFGMSGGVHG